MRESTSNPPSNTVPPNIDETTLVDAVKTSGYPLQGVVAEKLELAGFGVAEEWGFIDKDTQEQRSLDLLAFKILGKTDKSNVEPHVSLLIECKRTAHPYVFFKKVSEISPSNFPVVSAVQISIEEPRASGGRSKPYAPGQLILNLHQLPFVTAPPRCASFSKATPAGKRVELSGDEPFKKIILPLIKALQFKVDIDRVFTNADRQMPTLLLSIAVLDAPMLLVESPRKADDPLLTPWVRVFRLQANQDSRRGSHEFYGIDFVHIDILDDFLANHVLPFAEEFARRSTLLGDVWKHGGIVSDISNIRWDAITPKPK